MSTFFLVISAVLFIVTFGIHMYIVGGNKFDRPMYTNDPALSAIPWISGFILPVIPFSILTDYNWIVIFLVNFGFVFLLGPILTREILVRFSSGKGMGNDMVYSFVGGIVSLIIGLISNNN